MLRLTLTFEILKLWAGLSQAAWPAHAARAATQTTQAALQASNLSSQGPQGGILVSLREAPTLQNPPKHYGFHRFSLCQPGAILEHFGSLLDAQGTLKLTQWPPR